MFTITVTRKCGHQEKVTVDNLDPGANLVDAIDQLESAESLLPCSKCRSVEVEPEPLPEPKTYNKSVVLFWLSIVLFLMILAALPGIIEWFASKWEGF